MSALLIKISDKRIKSLTKQIAQHCEEAYDYDFKFSKKQINEIEKQVRKSIKDTINNYVLVEDMYFDNGLIDWNKLK